MLYTSRLLGKMLDNSFEFPYTYEVFNNSFSYDDVRTEKDGSCKITVTVPGFSKEDLILSVKENTLCLKDKEDKKLKKYWKLSESADLENIGAECKNGLLTINIPIKEKIDNTYTITIK